MSIKETAMNQPFRLAIAIRTKIAQMVAALSIDQLNKIPEGCNNNIAWHLGHIVVSSELLSYVRSECEPQRTIEGQEKYKNGTKPEGFISKEEINSLLSRLQSSIENILKDYAAGTFSNMQPYATHTFGVEMTTIEEVFEACSHHDLLHYGNIGIMRKLV